jgi:hypothetical protein
VWYTDGREGAAQRSFPEAWGGGAALRAAALALMERAVSRRVRVRRVRLEAWGVAPGARQLGLWDDVAGAGGHSDAGEARGGTGGPPAGTARDSALEAALDRVRGRFGAEALQPASWLALGIALRTQPARHAVRPSPRP